MATMKLKVFEEIITELLKLECRDIQGELHKKFPAVPKKTLMSIEAQEYQRKMKKTHHLHNAPPVALSYYKMFLQMSKSSERPGYLAEFAYKKNYSPVLMARIILEHYLAEQHFGSSPKPRLTKLLTDSTLIRDVNLSLEVHLCVISDRHYGPFVEPMKRTIGEEYEYKLRAHLQRLELPFLEESEMRRLGYDKTPDAKLEIPMEESEMRRLGISVDGHVINWIESKAMFGDPDNQQQYLSNQFWSYRNRFGPGLVIYWFGFVEELDSNREKGILLYDHFPTNIVLMDPDSLAQEI